jgi:hypothetical protein
MNTLRIATDNDQTWFEPGSTVAGTVSWATDEEADAVELRLFWYTSGKGTEEVELVDRLRMAKPGRHGERNFSFRLPQRPYSFSGRLITLHWGLELVLEPTNELESLEILLGPRPVEVDISRLREL